MSATTAATSPVSVTLDVAPRSDQGRPDRHLQLARPRQGLDVQAGHFRAGRVHRVHGRRLGHRLRRICRARRWPRRTSRGAAALLHQLHPRLKPDAIKALLQNSTVDANPSYETSLARQGVGSLRVSNAADLTSYASPGGISFGRLNPILPDVETETVTLYNMDNRTRVFKVNASSAYDLSGCHGVLPEPRWSCRAGGSQKFQVRLAVQPARVRQGRRVRRRARQPDGSRRLVRAR